MSAQQPPEDMLNQYLKISDLVKKMKNEDLDKGFSAMLRFVPACSHFILQSHLSYMVKLLQNREITGPLHVSILTLLAAILKADESTASAMVEDTKLIPSIFQFTRSHETHATEILLAIFPQEPEVFIDYLAKFPKCISPLISAASTGQDEEAGVLLLRLFCANPSTAAAMIGKIRPVLANLPVSCALGMMLSSQEMQAVVPGDQFEDWLQSKNRLSLFDVKSATTLRPKIWESSCILHLLAKTTYPPRIQNVDWISEQSMKLLTLNADETLEAENSLNRAILAEKPSEQICQDGYDFVRLFILSHANPERLSKRTVDKIASLTTSESQYLTAAAFQVFMCWAFQFGNKSPSLTIYRAAANVCDERVDPSIRRICAMFINAEAKNSILAQLIRSNEPLMELKAEDKKTMGMAKWVFPHSSTLIPELMKEGCVSQDEVVTALGEFANILEGRECREKVMKE